MRRLKPLRSSAETYTRQKRDIASTKAKSAFNFREIFTTIYALLPGDAPRYAFMKTERNA